MKKSNKADSEAILKGKLWQVVPFIVFPAMISTFMETAWHFLNGYWVGKLGPVSFAALNISSIFVWLFYALLSIINTGTSALVAQNEGANKRFLGLKAAHQGLMASVVFSVIISIFMIVFAKFFFTMMGAKPEVIKEACSYIFYIFIFGVPFALIIGICAVLRGYGDTKTPAKALFFSMGIVFCLDPILILGLFGFPRMGVAGGAIASNLGFVIGLFYVLKILLSGKHRFRINRKFLSFDFSILKKIIAIGLPVSANSVLFSVVAIVIGSMIAGFGTEAMAALGIGHRIESFCYSNCGAFSIGCIAIVGQNLGACNKERAQEAANISLIYVAFLTIIMSFLFYFFRYELARFFISDSGTVEEAAKYLKIISYSQIFMGISIVLDGVFAGSGKTLIPMFITLPVVSARIPLAYFLAFNLSLGIEGIWWAITILTFVKALLYFVWFCIGKWKTIPT